MVTLRAQKRIAPLQTERPARDYALRLNNLHRAPFQQARYPGGEVSVELIVVAAGGSFDERSELSVVRGVQKASICIHDDGRNEHTRAGDVQESTL